MRPAEDLQLHQLRVPASDVEQLIPDAARLVPGPPDLESPGRLGGGLLGHRLALVVALQRDLDPGRGHLRALALGQDGVGADPRRRLPHAGQLDTPGGLGDPAGVALQGEHLQLLAVGRRAGGWGTQCRQRRQQHDRQGRAGQPVSRAAAARGVVSGRRCHGTLLTGRRLQCAGLYPGKRTGDSPYAGTYRLPRGAPYPLGPEAPLMALGGGLGVSAVRPARPDVPAPDHGADAQALDDGAAVGDPAAVGRAYRHSADDRGGSRTARGVRGIGQLTRHPANNPATTSPAEARMRGFRPAGSMNGKVKHGKRSPSDTQSLERALGQRTDQRFGQTAP